MPADIEEFRKRVMSAESEQYIQFDEYLSAAVGRATRNYISIVPLPNIDHQVRQRVMADWRDVGWKISYVDDQRDGSYITISA